MRCGSRTGVAAWLPPPSPAPPAHLRQGSPQAPKSRPLHPVTLCIEPRAQSGVHLALFPVPFWKFEFESACEGRHATMALFSPAKVGPAKRVSLAEAPDVPQSTAPISACADFSRRGWMSNMERAITWPCSAPTAGSALLIGRWRSRRVGSVTAPQPGAGRVVAGITVAATHTANAPGTLLTSRVRNLWVGLSDINLQLQLPYILLGICNAPRAHHHIILPVHRPAMRRPCHAAPYLKRPLIPNQIKVPKS